MLNRLKQEKRFRSVVYLRYIASLSCVVCGSSPCQAHHLLRGSGHGIGLKAGDDMTIPLCPMCHRNLHLAGNERRWLGERGIDGPELAGILFQRWRDK